MSMRDEEEQEKATRYVNRPAPMDPEEQRFLRLHPGWMQAAWAHPDWPEWQRRRNAKGGP